MRRRWAAAAGTARPCCMHRTAPRPRSVANDEPELLELLADVLALGDEVTWGIDLADGRVALAIPRGHPSGKRHARQHCPRCFCMDAVGFAPDPAAALCEIYRILRPGARAVLTRAGRLGFDLVNRAVSPGFEVEHMQERLEEPELWRRPAGGRRPDGSRG